MKKIKPRLVLVLSLLVFVCEFHHVAYAQLSAEDTLVFKNPKPSVLPLWKYPVMIDGETDYHPSLRPQEWFNSKSNVPVSKLGEITNLGAKPRMVAFGGGLTAGVSNGGLYRESQQFAYPNLVAHQMGISDFESPLFSEEQANGTGFYKRSDFNAKYPRWKRVINKIDTMKSASEYPLVFTSYEGMNSNFAVPNGSTASLYYPYCPECDFQPYVSRFSSFKADNLRFVIDEIKAEQPYDFVIIEDFIDRWINGLRTTPQFSPYSLCFNGSIFNSGEITDYAINSVLEANQKGITFTIPHYKHLAYMNWYATEEL